MCLVGLAWQAHPRWRLLLLGNRDEVYHRAADQLQPWSDNPHIMAGRDLVSKGTWMGVDDRGRAAVVTNVRDPKAPGDRASRGALAADYLASRGQDARAYARDVYARGADYRAFNLLLLDKHNAFYVGNYPSLHKQELKPGIYGLSNAALDSPWPKTQCLKKQLGAWVNGANDDDFTALFAALADTRTWPDSSLPDTGVGIELERRLSAAFIRSESYGTRASTLIAMDYADHGVIIEQRFAAHGKRSGQNCLEF